MNEDSEKKELLGEQEGAALSYSASPSPPPKHEESPPKHEESPPVLALPAEEYDGISRPRGKMMGWLYDHRTSIPGYGMLKMIRGVRIYALYVLLAMLLAYLLNQLDRYTLPIVTTSAGYDLQYGDRSCMKNRKISEDVFVDNNLTQFEYICTDESFYDWESNETIDVK